MYQSIPILTMEGGVGRSTPGAQNRAKTLPHGEIIFKNPAKINTKHETEIMKNKY